MKTEDAVKMIELCLNSINTQGELEYLTNYIINKRIDLATPKKRTYIKKEEISQ